MARKARGLQILEDMDSTPIKYPCGNDKCGHKFSYTGKEYKKNRELSCPSCGWHTTADPDRLADLFSDHVRRIRALADQGKVALIPLGDLPRR
jgi:DNA-directed RNA polymerase subunit RPC12/RpoP